MINGDLEGRIFLSYTHPNNGFIFLLITVLICLFIFFWLFINVFFNKLQEVAEYAKMQFHIALLDVLGKIA